MMRIWMVLLLCGLAVGVARAAAGPYRLGSEDLFTVTVLKHPEYSGDFVVPPDGVVTMPVVGKVTVKGQTLDEVTVMVLDRLRQRLRQPEVTVTLKSARMQRIYVLGAVVKPGVYDLKDGWRVTEAMAAAGGTVDTTGQADVMVIHGDGGAETVDLREILRDGGQEINVALAAGDVVVVRRRAARIAVLGYVNKPGYYDIEEGRLLRLSEAIGLAAGAENKRGGLSAVAVLRLQDGRQTRVVYNLERFLKKGDAGQNPDIQAGDIIYVPETKRPDWQTIFQIVSTAALEVNLMN